MMTTFAFALITGTAHDTTQPEFDAAVAARATVILPTLAPRTGHFIYDGNRCLPENLGWRLRRDFGMNSVEAVSAGAIDAQIEATWHEAADCEHWYTHEKDWGF